MKKQKQSMKQSWKMNWRAFRFLNQHFPKMMALSISSILFQALSPYVTIYFSALVIGELAGERRPEVLGKTVILLLALTALLTLIRSVLTRYHEAEQRGRYMKFAGILNEKLLRMDFMELDKTQTRERLTQIEQNMEKASWGLYHATWNIERLVEGLCTVLGAVALTFTLFISHIPEQAGWLTVLDHPLFIMGFLALLLYMIYSAPRLMTKANSFWVQHVNDHILGNLLYIYYVNLANKREIAMDVRVYEQDRICKAYLEEDAKTGIFGSQGIFAEYNKKRGGLYVSASGALSAFCSGILYLYVCLKAWAGAFGAGAVTQYIAAVTTLAKGISGIIGEIEDMRNNAPFLQQFFEFLDIPNSMYKGSLSVEKRMDQQFEIEFRDVGFCYPGSTTWALRHVSFKFHVGERLAVVGENGSGKTTFIKLLCRLYDPTEGEILLNGIRIDKYNYEEYMNIFSVVFQDFKLFALPVGENVAAGSEVDRARAEDCLISAGFEKRLQTFPQGLDTCLYKETNAAGVDVSGGEAQKIALARALYKEAPFIILDEPTAALDPVAESEIYTRFNEIVGDHTTIYISHRLSSCRFCDHIAVFDKGSIVEFGNHDSLVANEQGKYYALWTAQAQYYAEEGIEIDL